MRAFVGPAARAVGRIVAAVAVVVAGVLLTPGTAYACSCVTADPAEFARNADVVVVGTIEGQRDPRRWWPMQSSGDPVSYTVRVDRVFKGRVGPVVVVGSVRDSATCGIEVDIGGAYVVYADRDGSGDLRANSCGGTAEADALALAAAGRTLGPPAPPDPSIALPEPRTSLLWPVAGIALAAAAVLTAAGAAARGRSR
ncbi:MAG: hypothetical protein M3165_01615 [Actinomycetota bacterium]|nr:hypothetical protein [Actinomycetota bacterium]